MIYTGRDSVLFNFAQLSDEYWTKDLLKGIFQVSQGGFKEGQKGILSALKEDVKYHRDYFVYYKNPLFFNLFEMSF